ncbi:hypothetical protein [Goodfellowiella coeruleoviolacea]|uniref:Uncharacterized protein n=1 Tax=Goodfellowiella coeruleoviolacea TaxID=334858 RepID=A0AAE3GAN8_9PSEU|nr:hypothetical protein [Goodfellowiella coeruleoviolacea]MCP2164313.1 hypothetical protein [Goodfellowiella coeruleoviolacea]
MTGDLPARPRSTTRRTLLRLGAGLLVLTAVTTWSAWLAFTRVHDAVPALVEVTSARTALVAADRAAVESARTSGVRLTGAGAEYRNQIGLASQNLAQAAEDNVAGDSGRQRLGLVEALLAVYTGSVEQAVNSRQNGAATLGAVELWQASHLLHNAHDGILAELDQLRSAQQAAGAATTFSTLSWAVPATVLAGLLGGTQVYLKRRFRRILSPALLGASLLLVGLVGVTALTLDTGSRVERFVAEPGARGWEQTAVNDALGQRELAELLDEQCAVATGGCGDTVSAWFTHLPPEDAAVDGAVLARSAAQARAANAEMAAVAERRRSAWLILATGGLVGVLVVVGLYPRVGSYRYRVR